MRVPPEAMTVTKPKPPPRKSHRIVRLSVPATGAGVREALARLTEVLSSFDIASDGHGNAEIVLAELLNNIVEHAYLDRGTGSIDLVYEVDRAVLSATVTDFGVPMPGSRMPHKRSANLEVARHELPEGGFGWFLIHELVDSLSYKRHGNRNIVRFSMRFG